MMAELVEIVTRATERERLDAYDEYGELHSLNEGYGVLAEEIDEVQESVEVMMSCFKKLLRLIREDSSELKSDLVQIWINAQLVACECIQVAAVAHRFIDLIDKEKREGADAG